jgi:nicotinate-nucleotide adenylyltransferase
MMANARVHPPPVGTGQRIGLLGGSFNPPHAAHVLVSHIARTRLNLDAIWWIVTPGNPLKSHAELAPLAARLSAARALVTDPRIQITGFEAELGTALTVETLGFLRRRYPGVRFIWIMGADNLATIHTWQAWQRIFTLMPVVVVDRPGWRLKAVSNHAAHRFARARVPERAAKTLTQRRPPAWTYLTGPLSPLSSTALRRQRRSKSNANPAN